MLVDLDSLRPKNETYEHFVIKQIARAWLFKKGVRYIACEVHIQGNDISPNGLKKIADVVGIERKKKKQPAMIKANEKITAKALELGVPLGLTMNGWGGRLSWINTYALKGETKVMQEASITSCYENACLHFGMPKEAYKRLRFPYKQEYTSYGCEVKVSRSDYQAGYNVSGDYTYLFTPKGLVNKDELPDYVGLVEVDLDKFHETKDWEVSTTATKRVKKKYDSAFFSVADDPKTFDKEKHEQFCQELVFDIAQESTEETVFWNPFLRNVPDGGSNAPELEYLFNYKVGDVTPLGIVIDRRIGEKTKADLLADAASRSGYLRSRYTSFYKFVIPNEGISKWTSQRLIEEAKNEKSLSI